ncbi:MAG TPA: NAD(P)H-dependent oxidoreductase subunit E [Candidatus Tyrphobacter sp.]
MSEREKAFSALLLRLRPECEAIVARYEHKRSALLPIMQLFQQHEGFVSPEAMGAVAQMLDLTPAVVESTVSFYTLLFRKPVGKYVVQVCRGLACTINGAEDVMQTFREKLGVGHLETTSDGLISYEEVECLAACDRATCGQVNLEYVYDLDEAQIEAMLAAMRAGSYAASAMAQTEKPERTWSVSQDASVARGRKSSGARGVQDPDNAGGIGDRSGVIMLDRIADLGASFRDTTRERLVHESRDLAKLIEEEEASGAGR